MKLRQVKHSELPAVRAHLHKKQKGICPILQCQIPLEEVVVDHKHKLKSQPIGEDGAGLIRGAIQRSANVLEGKIQNAFVRYGLAKYNITVPQFLRNLADYLEQNPYPWIHPTEKQKAAKLNKHKFNKLVKLYVKKYPNRKPLEYPKTGKSSEKWEALFEEFDIK